MRVIPFFKPKKGWHVAGTNLEPDSGGGGSYVLPIASADTLGGVKIGEGVSIDANGVLSAAGGVDSSMIAGTESTTTSTHAYAIGEYFISSTGMLCKATAAIAIDDTISIGMSEGDNAVSVTVGGELSELNSNLGRKLPSIDLGTSYTAELKQDISSGKFEKAVVGGYLTINGHVYDFAHPDYWLNTGDTQCTTHHMLVVPRGCLVSGPMNSTNITTGAYVGSDFYTGNNSNTALADIKAIIKADFGEANILTHRELLANTVDASGNASNFAWYVSDIDLMNEQMVYGGPCGAKPASSSIDFNMGIDKSQLKLFAERPDLITNRAHWWLRSVVSATCFAFVGGDGDADYAGAGGSYGIRPAFAIC